MQRAVLTLALLVAVAVAQTRLPVASDAHASPASVWLHDAPASPDTPLLLTVALHIEHSDDLEAAFWAVSDPRSAEYARYVDRDELVRRYAPRPDHVARVEKWLRTHGGRVVDRTVANDFLHVALTVAQAESMLGTRFGRYVHTDGRMVVRASAPYHVDASVAPHIAFVTGARLPRTPSHPAQLSQKRQFGQSVTPQVIWQMFGTNGTRGQSAHNTQCVAQFLGQYYSPDDLANFQQQFHLRSEPVTKVVGPNDPSNPGVEATLDIEYIMGAAPGIPTWFWSTGGLHEGQEPFVTWASALANTSTPPFVVSVSYGDPENTVTLDYAKRLDVEFKKLALRGVSVLFASGDNGVGCDSQCKDVPNWPASSPYVTAVGGFVFEGGDNLEGDSISSGGFSTFYSMPDYQAPAVKQYVASAPLPPSSQWKSGGRAVPDVSSFSENVMVVMDGFQQPVAGTSCAAPVFAGVVALVNDALLQAGKKPVGFLNQALYQFGAQGGAFLDVTTGTNAYGCCRGFPAYRGWDAITGWGGPNFPGLLAAFQAAQS